MENAALRSSPVPSNPDALSRSEESFRKGLACLERRTYREAVSFFQAAVDLETEEGPKVSQVKYQSYLGLALTYARGRSAEGLKLCQDAVQRDFLNPDLFCNLGIVYMRHRQRRQAFQAFRKGLELDATHRRILVELKRYDQRGEPVFPSLSRDHLLNRLTGRLRCHLQSLFTRMGAAEDR